MFLHVYPLKMALLPLIWRDAMCVLVYKFFSLLQNNLLTVIINICMQVRQSMRGWESGRGETAEVDDKFCHITMRNNAQMSFIFSRYQKG